MRIGFGFDVHMLVKDRDLIIGGEKIDYEYGLLGHSDADVLIHALMDGILGAMAMGDIGKLFPDTDPKYKDIDSKILLDKVYKVMDEKGYKIANIDSTVALESPKIGKIIPKMEENIAKILHTDLENISIKATTTESLGYVGEKKGAAAYVVVLLEKK